MKINYICYNIAIVNDVSAPTAAQELVPTCTGNDALTYAVVAVYTGTCPTVFCPHA